MKETRQGYLPLTPLAYLIFVNVGTPKKCTGLKKKYTTAGRDKYHLWLLAHFTKQDQAWKDRS